MVVAALFIGGSLVDEAGELCLDTMQAGFEQRDTSAGSVLCSKDSWLLEK